MKPCGAPARNTYHTNPLMVFFFCYGMGITSDYSYGKTAADEAMRNLIDTFNISTAIRIVKSRKKYDMHILFQIRISQGNFANQTLEIALLLTTKNIIMKSKGKKDYKSQNHYKIHRAG